MLNQLQRGDEPALRLCRRSGFLRRPYTDKLTCPHGPEWDIKLLPVDQCRGNCSHISGLTGIVEYQAAEN
jgi:hypothetical protein